MYSIFRYKSGNKTKQQSPNAINNLKPLFVKQDHLVYDYFENSFEVNEYRYFDTKSIRYQS